MELLAPAGSKEAFYAALGSGADAIYLGVDVLNARRHAQNISRGELSDLTRLAHVFNTKVYLTVNTVIIGEEWAEPSLPRAKSEVQAMELIAEAWAAGVDAIIVQDLGLIDRVRQQMPEVRLHASTQINIHNADTLRAVADLGVARITLARELSLDEIEVLAAVAREAGVEVEVFGHGALCVSYSGQCLFSSLVGRRSANRGLCAQPCRLPYELIDHRGDVQEVEGAFLLSPKDLSSIDHLERLEAAGVASLKIEGRMKKPAYVAAVVSAYKAALPQGLTDAFNRALTPAYLEKKSGSDLMDYHRKKNPTTQAAQEALTQAAEERIARVQEYRQPLSFSVCIEIGKLLFVSVSDETGNCGSYEGELVEEARTKTITEEEVRTQLSRLGNTPYRMDKLKLNLGERSGLSYSLLNKARREAVEDYETNRFFGGTPRIAPTESPSPLPYMKRKRSLSPAIIAVVSSLAAAKAVLNAGANEAHLNAWLLEDAEPHPDIVPVLPRVARDNEQDTYYGIAERFGRAVCSTLGQLATCKTRGIPAQSHWSLNITNPYAVQALVEQYGVTRVWLSPELSGRQIAHIADYSRVPLGTALFGQQEVMVTEVCVLTAMTDTTQLCTRSCADCNRRARHFALRDRKGYCFPVNVDPQGRSHLYNSVPLDLTAALPELLDAGVDALRLDLENALNTQAAREIARARRNLIAHAGDGELETAVRPDTITKGHFFRGVL